MTRVSIAKVRRLISKLQESPNIKVAYWLVNNVDFDQCILEYYQPDDDQHGWIHVSYNEKGANRKKVLTFDGKIYKDGLPDIEYKKGEISN